MIKLIIFDWDDVIILGSKIGYYNCYRETINELGINMNEEEMYKRIQRKWGKTFKEGLRELLKEKPELLDKACLIYDKKFYGRTFINSLKEVNGVNELLTRLNKKFKLAVATGNHPLMLKKIMDNFNITKVFSQIISSFEVSLEKTKPDPYMINLILKEQGLLKEEALYVGDAENDVLMARNAGVEPVVVLTGHLNREQAEKLGVKHIITNVTDLESILNK